MENQEREQPFMEPANVSGETIEDRAVSENGSLENTAEGDLLIKDEDKDFSPSDLKSEEAGDLGKFKSVQALFDAYNNLQASFTKKCQRLSELEKEKTEQENQSKILDEKLDKFLLENAEAKNYAEEIKEVFSQGKTLSPEEAWNKVMLDHIKEESEREQMVDKYVLDNENVKNKIIQDYLNSLKVGQPPKVISGGQGQRVSEISSGTPSSMSEARKALENMFR